MGDYFQVIVDRDATLDEAALLGARILAQLVERGIVLPTLTDCILSNSLGYPPGPNYVEALTEPWPDFLTLRTNGLEIISKRTVFHAGQGGINFVCNACDTLLDPDDLAPRWDEAILEWWDSSGMGLLSCPHCGHSEPVADWGFDPPWGFGNLGFEFWNWPELAEEFVEEVGAWLGHRVVVVYGKV